MQDAHNAVVIEEFIKQADVYHREVTKEAPVWIARSFPLVNVALSPTSTRVLDVCCGTGAVTRVMAPFVKSVTGVDLTQEMLDQAQASLTTDNVTLIRNDFLKTEGKGEYDVVISRWALHHWKEPELFFQKMMQHLAPGGVLVVVDLVSPFIYAENDAARKMQDHLETLRDPSHTRIHSVDEIRKLLQSVGLKVPTTYAVNERSLKLEPWLNHSFTPNDSKAVIREILKKDSETPTAFFPFIDADGEQSFRHTDAFVAGIKP
jgi:SAM-dependent methyltransferase